ncbi:MULTISPECIES: hypothetical protein [unclassified Nostoc]|uniref:hypothetical protein n=1 Tax=unclassified Nostoc TaxID=2593658 RepID=UPI0025EE019A|nr:hypothetical protein [Nostoc sp. JL33]MBN3870636.1 hypothetical protein [Nostoc sp. JL33]
MSDTVIRVENLGKKYTKLADLIAEWWEKLKPGSNYEEETLAQARNREEVKAFGYRFLEIARTEAF